MIVIASVAGRLGIESRLDILQNPLVAIDVIAFDLMTGCCDAQRKPLGNFLVTTLEASACRAEAMPISPAAVVTLFVIKSLRERVLQYTIFMRSISLLWRFAFLSLS